MKNSIFLFFISFMFACNSNALNTFIINKNGQEFIIRVNEILSSKDNIQEAIIKGSLVFNRSKQEIDSLNLNCFTISGLGWSSTKIYVDSVAHFLTDKYEVSKGDNYIPVYWLVNAGRKIVENTDMKVVLTKNCRLFNRIGG